MTRTVPAQLATHLADVSTTTTRLLKITLKSGFVYGLSMTDRTITYDDGAGPVDYIATNGFDPSTVASDLGYSVDNAEGFALISDTVPGVTTEMVERGELDDATWILYLVNFEDLTAGRHILIDAGDLGQVKARHGMVWIPELLSYVMRLKQPIGGVWSRTCRAIFGTPAASQTGCGIDADALWTDGSVTAVGAESDRAFTGDAVTGSSPAITPLPGRVRWTYGNNTGQEISVEAVDGFDIELTEPTRYPIEIGDEYEIRPDCGKQYERDCIGVWNNGINFKGEPLIPVGDAASNQVPGAQVAGGGVIAQAVDDAVDDVDPPVIVPGPALPAGSGVLWDNWPGMVAACHQGDSDLHILDPARWAELAEKNLIIVQSFNATDARKNARKTAIDGIHAINPNVVILWYTMAQETVKVLGPLGNDSLEISSLLVADPVKGNPNWIVHRRGMTGDSGRCESNFPTTGAKTRWNLNMAVLVAGENSLGQNFAEALMTDWYDAYQSSVDFIPYVGGIWFDNFNARPPNMYQANGTITVTDQDYDQDGVADPRGDFGSGSHAGGRFWAQGHLELIAQTRAIFGDDIFVSGNTARIASDYIDGLGSPPTPITLHPFYHQLELPMPESMNLSLGLQVGSSYAFNGGGSVASFFRVYSINEKMLIPDASSDRTGNKNAVLLHALCVNRTTPTSADYAYARFLCGLTMLAERAAMCVMQSASLPLSLDEMLIDLGDPLNERSMGTLDENAPGSAFPLRAADIIVSGNTIHYALFGKAGWFVNTTSPSIGPYPSADAAVTFDLPTPPAGKKWKHFDSATYEHPTLGRAMRGQDTTLNNGADATTATLKRYHAVCMELADI